jgi:hypothetical protein
VLRRMKLARLIPLSLGLICATAIVACGSSGVEQFPGDRAGGPATAVPTHGGGDGGVARSSSSGSGSSSGSSGSSSSSSGSSGGDAGVGTFGPQTFASFTLIDAKITDAPIGSPVPGFDPITFGATIDLGTVGVYLSLRADPPQGTSVGSIAFALDATFTHTAETTPYSVCGDDGKGTFTPCQLPVGKHTLTATMYPESQLSGTPYPPTVFEFLVIDSTADGGTD